MIFVDTGFFYALASKADPDHDRVKEVFGGCARNGETGPRIAEESRRRYFGRGPGLAMKR